MVRMFINQRKYIKDILEDDGLLNCKIAKFPLPTNLRLDSSSGELFAEAELFRRLVGRLLYLALTRPYISYAVQYASQFVASPQQPHYHAVLHILKYLWES